MLPNRPFQRPLERLRSGDLLRSLSAHEAAIVIVLLAHVALALGLYCEAFVRIDDRLHALVSDDAFISMCYGRELARHAQLVWSDGQRIEGFSNLLWTLIMALTHLVPLPARLAALPILLLNVLLVPLSAALAAAFAVRITRELGHGSAGTAVAAVAAAGCVLLNFNELNYAAGGWEVALAAIFLLLACRLWNPPAQPGSSDSTGRFARARCWKIAGLFLLAALTRAELGGFLCGLLLVAALWRAWRRQALTVLLILLSGLALLALWRFAYFGDVFPNTCYLKVSRFPHRWINGLRYAGSFLIGGGAAVLLIVGVAALRGSPSARFTALFVGLFIPYVAFLGGDAFALYRLYAPVFPLLAALAAAGFAHAAVRLEVSPRVAVALALVMLVVTTNAESYYFFRELAERRWEGVPNPPAVRLRENIILAQWLNEHTPPGSRVAAFMVGALAYFCDRPIVDLLGKCERHIARLPAGPGQIPGHNKYDFDYVIEERRPDYILGERRAVPPGSEPPPDEGASFQRDYGFTDALAYNKALQRNYRPLPAPYPYSDLRTIYGRNQ